MRNENDPRGSFSFVPDKGKWVMVEKGGYPARPSVIREMLIGFSELSFREAKTKDPSRYPKLELSDIQKETSKATRLLLEDQKGQVLLDAVFGKRVQSITGSTPFLYMRKSGEAQTWLTSGELEIRGGALDWLTVSLLTIQRERIKNAVFYRPDHAPLRLLFNKKLDQFEIRDLPSNRTVKSRFQLLNVGMVPENLLLQDVLPAKDFVPNAKLGSAIWETNDGLTITLNFAKNPSQKSDTRSWGLFDVAVAQNAKEQALKDHKKIKRRTSGWAFWLGDGTMKKLRATQESLTQLKKAN